MARMKQCSGQTLIAEAYSCKLGGRPRRRQWLSRVQGRTGSESWPKQFPDDLPPYRLSLGKILKTLNSEITFFQCKNGHFLTYTIPAHRALPKCKHGQSSPGRV